MTAFLMGFFFVLKINMWDRIHKRTSAQNYLAFACLFWYLYQLPSVGVLWTLMVCTGMHESLCTLFTLLLAASVGSAALGWQQRSGAAAPGWTSADKLAEVILRPECNPPAYHHIWSGRGTAEENQRHKKNCLIKNLACFWPHQSAWGY